MTERLLAESNSDIEDPLAASSSNGAVRSAHLSLVMPTDAATHSVVTAAVGQVSGSSGAAEAGEC
ncbi:MAG TPA: hypothetical protein VHF06_37440 [Pseudonocardiaceae bacterium]|jgi:hypothetical protein|nr:hypothetical protein [Pseudonocardiaceae bacterium]